MSESTSTSSPASAGSPSQPEQTESEQSSLSRSTSAAEISCPERGQASPSMTTCGRSAGVWPTPQNVFDARNKTSGRSNPTSQHHDGILLADLLHPSPANPLCGSLPPVFPVSPPAEQVSSEERKTTAGSGRRLLPLFDQSTPLGRCSKTLLALETWASPEFSLRWKVKATKCGCSVFQLAPSVRRTGESGIGSWQTVTQALAEKSVRTRDGAAMECARNAGPDLGAALATWPTPEKAMADGGHHCRSGDRKDELLIGGLTRGPAMSGLLALIPNFADRLLCLSAWLMGYEWNYLMKWERRGLRGRKTDLTEASWPLLGTQSSGPSQHGSSAP